MRAGVLASVLRIHYGDGSVDTERGQEPEGGLERQGARGHWDEGAGKERRQSKKGQLLSTDGKHARVRKGRKGKANSSSS
tara:strand:- start:576 stop:815 length:240 start_codon:yes stop_codon:yes gene_type:complete